MGTDFTFVSPAISVGSTLGMAGIVGATILGSLFEVVLSFFIKPLMKLFPVDYFHRLLQERSFA